MSRRGFTLVELALVVTLIGMFAALATPMFDAYLRRTRAVEARTMLEGIAHAELAYFRDHGAFIACAPSPAEVPNGARATFDTSREGWKSLGFRIDGAIRYQYEVALVRDSFVAVATGDLDGNGLKSRFELSGRDGQVRTTAELE